MRITGDNHRSRPRVSLLDHDLMTDSSTSGVEVDSVLLSELLDVGVLGEVLLGLVLDVVVEGEDGLGSSVDFGELERAEPERMERKIVS